MPPGAKRRHLCACAILHGPRIVTARRAWRFVGEMEEIAATFDAAGLPSSFHEAAAEVYGRMAGFKDEPAAELDAVLQALLALGDARNGADGSEP